MLTRRNAALKDENWLAESWKLENGKDGKPVLDVRLRKGVRFHNGDPLTAEDFEFSWQRQRDPKSSFFSHYVSSVERFEILDPYHFRLYFKEPDAQFIAGNMQLWAMPKKYIQKVGEEEFARRPVGTGPWKFVSRTVKDELRLEAFDGYWNQRPPAAREGAGDQDHPRGHDARGGLQDRQGRLDRQRAAVHGRRVQEDARREDRHAGQRQQSLPELQYADARVAVQRRTRAPGRRARNRCRRHHQARAVRPWRALRPVGCGSVGYDPALKPYSYDPSWRATCSSRPATPTASIHPATT